VPEVPEERALASGEAAAALGIRVPVLLRLEAEGRITAFRTPGGTRRYPGAAVEVLRRELEAETAGLLTGVEVTSVLGVTSRTVGRYAATGKLTPVPGPGRTNWFRESEVRALLRGDRPEP
jgi:predicted site-specific integrase-resolvase